MNKEKPGMNVMILGAGALGAFYSSRLQATGRDSLCLLADGARYERLERDGLIVNGTGHRFKLTRPGKGAVDQDLVIVAVKHHHLDQAIRDMAGHIGPETAILSVMNGIDSEKRLGEAYGMEKVLFAVAIGIDGVREGNRITVTNPGKILFGEKNNAVQSERVRRIASLFERAGIPFETPEDMPRVLWWKYMINVGVNQVSAVLKAPYGVFQRSEEAREIMLAAMKEVVPVAEREGVRLTDEDMDEWIRVMSGLDPEGKTSMLQDVEAGRKTEAEMLGGTVESIGKQAGIPTPVNSILFRMIRILEQQAPGPSGR
jgi:2-dehydropantoate 2-reductase